MRQSDRPPGKRHSHWPLAMAMALLLATILAAGATSQQDMPQTGATQSPRVALVIDIDGVIGPAIADYVERQFKEIDPESVGLVILRLDTPGGLDLAMRKIIRAELASPMPVAAYVAPSGARAASAGTYIAYAASIAAMAPGTNLGAATPIVVGGLPEVPGREPLPDKPADGPEAKKDGKDEDQPADAAEEGDTANRKMVNDAVAYIRALAQLHGRNADWAESAVRGAASLPAEEALKQGVVDIVAPTLKDLLLQIDGREAIVDGQRRTLKTADLELEVVELDWRTQLLVVITNPNIAFVLMLIGVYGLIFELSNPGAILPGVLGGISLLLALLAFSALPIDYAGVALVLLGIALMVAEAFAPSFGVLGLGGVAAFVIGAIIMFQPGSPNFGLSISVIVGSTIVTAGLLLLALAMLVRSRGKPVVTGGGALIGAAGDVIDWSEGHGRVRILGEIWLARATEALRPGQRVKVRGRDGLRLQVEPDQESKAKEAPP